MISLEFLIEKRYSTTKETQTFPVHTILHAVNNHYSTLLSRFVIFRQQEEEKRIKTQYFGQGKVMGNFIADRVAADRVATLSILGHNR